MSPRPRERILNNLETIYREAYERAKETGDEERKMGLDASFQKEQLILEVLLDVRDAMASFTETSMSEAALKKLATLRNLGKLTKP